MNDPELTLTYLGRSHTITPEKTPFTIGRSPENHLCIALGQVSGRHGQIEFADSRFKYRDMDSTNGTLITGSGDEQFIRNSTLTLSGSGSIGFGRPSVAAVSFEVTTFALDPSMETAAALAALNDGDYAAAGKRFEALIDIRPAYAAGYYYAGFCAARENRLQKAIVRFEQYRLLRPDDAGVWSDLGRIYERDGSIEEAVRCFLKALSLAPGLIPAKQGIQRLAQDLADRHNGPISRKTSRLLGTRPETLEDIPHFRVTWYPGYHLDILKCLLKALESAVAVVHDVIDFFPEEKIPVWILPDDGDASGRTSARGIVLKAGSLNAREVKFLSVLAYHEYAHYALGCAAGFSHTVPWWIQEGFAQQVSDPIRQERLERLEPMAAAKTMMPLQSLEKNPLHLLAPERFDDADMPTRTDVIENAYLHAHAAVAFLLRSDRRQSGFPVLVKSLGRGCRIEQAFRNIGSSYDGFSDNLESWIIRTVRPSAPDHTERIRWMER